MIGQQIQNYTIISQLGQGGMGTVYKAVDNVLGREVALKMLNTLMINQPQVLERFKKEAQVLARLLHPNIAVIYNLIEQSGQHFMVIEYVEGKNLDELLRPHKTLPYKMVALIFMQALEGLQHAHRKGIFHRDIKPSNLILTPYGTVKIMDFGIAKVAGEQRMTQVNRVIGTIEFLAPEIIEGKEPSFASDIYATGVTMYELLSGKLPFENTTDFNLMQEILKKKPVALDKMNPAVPKALSDIVMKALEKKPENRFADAAAFQKAIAASFPELRGVDLSELNAQLDASSATPMTQVIAQPRKNVDTALLQSTRMESITKPHSVLKNFQSKASDGLQNIQQKYLATNRNRIIAGAILGLLIFFLGFSIFSKSDEPKINIADNVPSEKNPSGDKKQADNNSNIPTGDNGVTVPVSQQVDPQTTTKPITPGTTDPVHEPEKKVPEKKKEQITTPVTKDPPAERKEPVVQTPVTEPHRTKTVEIRGRVVVKIRLADNIRSVDNLSEGQALRFVVTEPVEYENETIIRSGASVSARVKGIGRMLIAIEINSIESAGGKRINLDRVGLTKLKKDFPEAKVYPITLGRGVTVSY